MINLIENLDKLVNLGAKVWEKGTEKRVYLNNNAQLELLGAKITTTPKYATETTGLSNKEKLYFDLNKEIFLVDKGAMKNTLSELGFKVARI